jgi:hypothetical protein
MSPYEPKFWINRAMTISSKPHIRCTRKGGFIVHPDEKISRLTEQTHLHYIVLINQLQDIARNVHR